MTYGLDDFVKDIKTTLKADSGPGGRKAIRDKMELLLQNQEFVAKATGGTLTEQEPFLATSMATPTRVVGTTELAVSPPTHDYKRYLYALDQHDGTIIVNSDVH